MPWPEVPAGHAAVPVSVQEPFVPLQQAWPEHGLVVQVVFTPANDAPPLILPLRKSTITLLAGLNTPSEAKLAGLRKASPGAAMHPSPGTGTAARSRQIKRPSPM